jgi:hypothetical protein
MAQVPSQWRFQPARPGRILEDAFHMTTPRTQAVPRMAALAAALGAAALLSACVIEAPPRYVQAPPRPAPAPVYEQPAPVYEQPAQDDYAQEAEPVVSVYVDPPIEQPEPIAVQWAPPPMLVEVPPPQPYPDAVWTGGYWSWEGRWFWAAGRWSPPPRPHYVWVQPYYEHRADVVVFVPGFWCAPERHFVPPPPGLRISVAFAAPGIRRGRPPMGPQGVFVPPPPGSRHGLIVPAPVGTPPAVVVSAPPVVNVGMRVHGNVDVGSSRNVGNVTVEAPAAATANGQAFHNSVPARAHLAAELAPVGRPAAPQPVSQQAIPAYQPGRAPIPLPAGQPLRNERSERNDRFNGQNGARYATPPQPGAQPAPQGQAQQQQQQQPQPRFGQGRPEFDQPPRTPAPINGQPQPQVQGQQPAWQHGQQVQQGQQPAWQQGQQRQGYGQPPQGQAQGQPQQLAPQPIQQPQGNPQDPRRRGGNPQGQAPAAQPGAQAVQPAVQGQPAPQARAKDAKDVREPKDERKKTEHERQDDRDKKNGERDR